MKERILIVDDDAEQCELMRRLVAHLGYETLCAMSGEAALDHVGGDLFDAVLTDLEMPTMGGVELCTRIAAARPDVPVIFVTGVGSMASAVEAMRAGAYDFLTKPVDASVVALSLRRAIEHRRLSVEVKLLRGASAARDSAAGMIGESANFKRVQDLVDRVARTDVSVLIEGETGTGKELVARALHRLSGREGGPFVAINCAAVPANLLESELFGHTRGAFTDAKAARDGLFVQASGGTLFLDEIGEMPLEMQPKLLRALQERTLRPVGGNTEVAFDTRIVAATHRDLENDIAERRFREDLYYRIHVVKIPLPPLRERGNDVLMLSTYFLNKCAARSKSEPITLSPQVAAILLSYDWPGNVRELENCIERLVALARFDTTSAEDLPEKIRTFKAQRFVVSADREEEILSLEELERRYILRALDLVGGNRSRVAILLGLDRRTLYRRLEKYGVGSSSPIAHDDSSSPPHRRESSSICPTRGIPRLS